MLHLQKDRENKMLEDFKDAAAKKSIFGSEASKSCYGFTEK